jgi:hypothetical protein
MEIVSANHVEVDCLVIPNEQRRMPSSYTALMAYC